MSERKFDLVGQIGFLFGLKIPLLLSFVTLKEVKLEFKMVLEGKLELE